MSAPALPIIEARREQMFPVLDARDIKHLQRFGEIRHYEIGASVMKAGEVAPGLILILSGKVQVSQGGNYSALGIGPFFRDLHSLIPLI